MRVPCSGGGTRNGPSVGSGSLDWIAAGVAAVLQISMKSTPVPLSRTLGGMPSLMTTERPDSSWPVTTRRAGLGIGSPLGGGHSTLNYRMREYGRSAGGALQAVDQQLADEFAIAGAGAALIEGL